MQDQPNQGLNGPVNIWPLERALLMLLLRNGPGQLTSHELTRELQETPDAVEHAIDALVGAGLVRREGALVLPTRAAVRFDELGV
jgi:DNA-binding MarR family transcriptional regulator